MYILKIICLFFLSFSTSVLLAGESTMKEKPVDSAYVIKNFKFRSGETLPELKLHYTTLGTRKLDANGRTINAVLLLHGTTGTGKNYLNPSITDALFGPGQPLDASKYFIIMPDGIGRGGSSKPSDGLRGKFPHYGYIDLVVGQHALVTKGLGIDHLKLILGTSMGGMNGWLWGEMYPDAMDAIAAIACQPVAITGRNFFWRNLIMEAIKNDPDYNNGNYTKQPSYFQNSLPIFNILTGSPKTLEAVGKTQKQAKAAYDKWVKEARKNYDANDYLYWFDAVADYNPEPDLGKIKAKVLAINFADDLLNAVQLGIMERTMPKVKNGKYILVPESANTVGHQTLNLGKVWAPYVQELMNSLDHN
jgi:homoserine O-acetyltransferase